jgi:hypothetical protein
MTTSRESLYGQSLAATKRKLTRKRDFAVAATDKIMSDAAGLARLVPVRGSKAPTSRDVYYGRAVLAVAEEVAP